MKKIKKNRKKVGWHTDMIKPIEFKYPNIIIRLDDNEKFIHLGEGYYRTEWGNNNGSISKIPLHAFNKDKFKFLD
jgi:hypothetical protein